MILKVNLNLVVLSGFWKEPVGRLEKRHSELKALEEKVNSRA